MKIIYTDLKEMRLDVFLARELSNYSRSYLSKIIKEGNVFVNGNKINKSSSILNHNDEVFIELPELKQDILQPSQDIDLDILYEDEDIIVINKQCGISVHPGNDLEELTIANALLYKYGNLSDINGKERPGIVHRLDKETSGILVCAKNNSSHLFLSKQFYDRKVFKEYLALTHGRFKSNKGTINKPIGRNPKNRTKMCVIDTGKEAITNYSVIETNIKYTFLSVVIETGRTHQIRVHMKAMGHEIVGDTIYGRKKESIHTDRLMLHSYKIKFIHPKKNKLMEFTSIPNIEFLDGLIKAGINYNL